MEFTDTERLILANQYEILGKLNSDEDYLKLAENLKDGHEWIYNQKFFMSPIFDKEKSNIVVDILDLYRALQRSYDDLTIKGSLNESKVKFPGFDGNNEGEYKRFVSALVENGQFDCLRADTNSHTQKVVIYQNMLDKWKVLGREQSLSLQDMEAILN